MEQPFHDLNIFKEQTARNIGSLSPDNKVAELVQADKDAEIVLMGLLKAHMLDLYEALSWQYASMEDVESKRRRLLAACEEQLETLKREFLPTLAKEHGVQGEFCTALKEPEKCTVDDFEKLSDLDFALMVWRQNLKRSLGLASSCQDKEELVRIAYVSAEALVKRCLNASHKAWNAMARWAQASLPRTSSWSMARSPTRPRSASLSDAPLGGDSIITIYERAMAQVWLRLEAIAQQHGVADALQALLRINRASSHPLSFGQVAVALDQVTKALDAGQQPEKAQEMAVDQAQKAPINPPVLAAGTPAGPQAKLQPMAQSTTVVTEE